MIQKTRSLRSDSLKLLHNYIQKFSSIIEEGHNTNEVKYFLFELKDKEELIKEISTKSFLDKCINAIINEDVSNVQSAKLLSIRKNLIKELELLKLKHE